MFSAFIYMTYDSEMFGRLELWSNLARFDVKDGVVRYWYVYARNEYALWGGLLASVKVSHTYRQEAQSNHDTFVSVELRAML